MIEADIDITKTRVARILQAISESSQYLKAIPKRKQHANDLKLLYKRREPLRQYNNDKRRRSWRKPVMKDVHLISLCRTPSLFGKRLIC